jgi:hypothetical protein
MGVEVFSNRLVILYLQNRMYIYFTNLDILKNNMVGKSLKEERVRRGEKTIMCSILFSNWEPRQTVPK